MPAPTERVQVIKDESTAGGGDPSDAGPLNPQVPINETEDAISAAGFVVQAVGGTADMATLIWREGSDLKFKDGSNPSGFTLSSLGSGGGGGVSEVDFLLENEPSASDTEYTPTISGGVVTEETWDRTGGNKIKDIIYTRSGGLLESELRTVYDTDGTTVLGELEVTYTRTDGRVTSIARDRT